MNPLDFQLSKCYWTLVWLIVLSSYYSMKDFNCLQPIDTECSKDEHFSLLPFACIMRKVLKWLWCDNQNDYSCLLARTSGRTFSSFTTQSHWFSMQSMTILAITIFQKIFTKMLNAEFSIAYGLVVVWVYIIYSNMAFNVAKCCYLIQYIMVFGVLSGIWIAFEVVFPSLFIIIGIVIAILWGVKHVINAYCEL